MASSVLKAPAVLLACLFAVPVAAEVPDAFRKCARCHGDDGMSRKAETPSIAGFSADYLALSMKDYRDGKRECVKTKMKCSIASKWTDAEIEAAAQYYSGLPRAAPTQEADAALAARGAALHEQHCAGCHGVEPGTLAADALDGGALKGQWMPYLSYSLELYDSGGRHMPDKMKTALEGLSADDRNALLHYYAAP